MTVAQVASKQRRCNNSQNPSSIYYLAVLLFCLSNIQVSRFDEFPAKIKYLGCKMGFKTTGSVTSVSAPQITADLPSRITKRVGERLDLRCTVSGTPNPVVSWKLDGETISGNNPRISCVDGNRRLLIRNLTVQDAGVYTCVARNQNGEVSRSSRVVVQANHLNELPNILEQPQDECVVGGQQATLSCVSTVPPSQFYGIVWKKDGQLLKETSRCKYRREHISNYTIRATYTISQARLEDRGMYTAVISTCIHSISSKAGYLDVR